MGVRRELTMNKIIQYSLLGGEVIASGASFTTAAVDLRLAANLGLFSVDLKITSAGAGLATLTYLTSNDGINFSTPTGALNILTSFTKTSGPDSDGRSGAVTFEPPLCTHIKLKAAVADADSTITLTLNVQ
jgi:hypothetical protein